MEGPLQRAGCYAAERAVLALGATRIHGVHEDGFRVFTDPAGHPFCLVFP